MAPYKNLGTLSKIKVNEKKLKSIKTRFLFDIKHDTEGKMTRYTARLVTQGFNQVPKRDFYQT